MLLPSMVVALLILGVTMNSASRSCFQLGPSSRQRVHGTYVLTSLLRSSKVEDCFKDEIGGEC